MIFKRRAESPHEAADTKPSQLSFDALADLLCKSDFRFKWVSLCPSRRKVLMKGTGRCWYTETTATRRTGKLDALASHVSIICRII
ncbi:hypothetical protein BaRGS_00003779 [Batillaria attramentaria]|uniref:Uncharacterized protein n=1 Tax=Batillaria attramentaria TaxID=370345 RepID=A0ABD0M093_9CAEN